MSAPLPTEEEAHAALVARRREAKINEGRARLRELRLATEAGDAARAERLRLWAELEDDGLQQYVMADDSGVTAVTVSQALKRYRAREKS